MRDLFILITVALLGIAPLGGRSVLAQEAEDEAWSNVARPTSGAQLEWLDELQASLTTFGAQEQAGDVQSIRDRLVQEEPRTGYVVTFQEQFAHIPEIPEAELMAVYVRSGEFVLDNMGPEPFTVVPGGGRTVAEMNITGDDQEAHYTLDEAQARYLQNENGAPCTDVCVVTPQTNTESTPRIALQLLEGDWALFPGQELCVWCLLNSYAKAGETTGILYVYPLLAAGVTAEDFSWIRNWDEDPKPEYLGISASAITAPALDGSGTTESLSGVMAWAFFNPAPNCRSG